VKTRPIAMMVGIGTAVLLACTGLAAEPFDYFQNSWSVVGLKDYMDATRINPENELLLADGQKLRFCFGRNLTPLSRQQTKHPEAFAKQRPTSRCRRYRTGLR